MKNPLKHLHKAFENRIRLSIMSVLVVNEHVDYNTLKDQLQLTDGNLASHLKYLEKEEFITVEKDFIGRKPRTRYMTTPLGVKSFREHIDALESIIKGGRT